MKNNIKVEELRIDYSCMNRDRIKRFENKYRKEKLKLDDKKVETQEKMKLKNINKENDLEVRVDKVNDKENLEVEYENVKEKQELLEENLELKQEIEEEKLELVEPKLEDLDEEDNLNLELEDIEEQEKIESKQEIEEEKLELVEPKLKDLYEINELKLELEEEKEEAQEVKNLEEELLEQRKEAIDEKDLNLEFKDIEEKETLQLENIDVLELLEPQIEDVYEIYLEDEIEKSKLELELQKLQELEILQPRLEDRLTKNIEKEQILEIDIDNIDEKDLEDCYNEEVFKAYNNISTKYSGQIYKGKKIIFNVPKKDVIVSITNIDRELEINNIEVLEKGINVCATICISINYGTSKDIFIESQKDKDNEKEDCIVPIDEKMPIISTDGVVRNTTVSIPCNIYINTLEIDCFDKIKLVSKCIRTIDTQYILDNGNITNGIIPIGNSLKGIIENYIVSVEIEVK